MRSSENYAFIGDFNMNSSMKELSSSNGLKNLVKQPICYKNSEKPTWTNLILTNQPTLFQHSTVLWTWLSDFYLLRVTGFKMVFQKCELHIITYQNYKNYENDACRSEYQNFCSLNETDSGLFMETIFYICNKHAPVRKKYLRTNEWLKNSKML